MSGFADSFKINVNPFDPFGDRAHDRAKQAAKDQFKRARKARQTEYQDKVHSLEAAGLNRILAAGGAPSPANASMAATSGPEASSEVDPSKREASNTAKAQQSLMSKQGKQAMATAKATETQERSTKELLRGIKADSDIKEMDANLYKKSPNLRKTKLMIDSMGNLVPALLGGSAVGLGSLLRNITGHRSPKYKKDSAKHYRGLDKM